MTYQQSAENRESAARRGYGHRWRKLRQMVLKSSPLCVDPFGLHAQIGEVMPGTQVDHILPKNSGGTDALDNLQTLCHSCHSRKTAHHDGGFGKRNGANPQFEIRERTVKPNFVIHLCGSPATGKSFLANQLIEQFGIPAFSIDNERFALVNPGEKWADDSLEAWVNFEDKINGQGVCIAETSGNSGNDPVLFKGRHVFRILCVASDETRRQRLEGRVLGNYRTAATEWRYVERLLSYKFTGRLKVDVIFNGETDSVSALVERIKALLLLQTLTNEA